MLYKANALTIFFGNERERFIPSLYKKMSSSQLLQESPFVKLSNTIKINHLFFLHQVHGIQGIIIDSPKQMGDRCAFEIEGDFLITHLNEVGIAVATADCLPIILHDTQRQIISIIHAGWRGSVDQVALYALNTMCKQYGTQVDDVHVFFGPSAKSCCYTVGDELISKVMCYTFANDVLYDRKKVFFDLPRFNQLLLQEQGIRPEAFHTRYNLCTLCDTSFCSYRRQQGMYRQMTVVSLKNINPS